MTLSRFDNTFVVMYIDEKSTIKFINHIIKFKHALFLRKFNFSDSYVCFLNIDNFIEHLRYFYFHIKNLSLDGTNIILSYVYKGIFLNLYNLNLIENILLNKDKIFDFENLFIQIFIFFLLFLENIFIYMIDSFFVYIEKNLLLF